MLETVISLQERLTRLPYFGGSVTLGLSFFAGLAAIVMSGALAVQATTEALPGFAVCLLPLVSALLWCSLSLHVRGIRDICWNTTLVFADWLVFKIVDDLILAHVRAPSAITPARSPCAGQH